MPRAPVAGDTDDLGLIVLDGGFRLVDSIPGMGWDSVEKGYVRLLTVFGLAVAITVGRPRECGAGRPCG